MKESDLERLIRIRGSVDAAAETLGVTRQTIWNWRERGVSRLGVVLIQNALEDEPRAGRKAS